VAARRILPIVLHDPDVTPLAMGLRGHDCLN
jgi:hypothetical protein